MYEQRENIPLLPIDIEDQTKGQVSKIPVVSIDAEDLKNKSGYIGGVPKLLFTSQGAIKFNMWKQLSLVRIVSGENF